MKEIISSSPSRTTSVAAVKTFCTMAVTKYGWHACVFVCPHTEVCAEYKKAHKGAPPCGAITPG